MPVCVTCCSYPNGYLTLAPCLVSIVAYVLSSIACFACRYAETQLDNFTIGVGLLFREISSDPDSLYYYSSTCTTYGPWGGTSDFIVDEQLKAAQGFGLTTWIVGFIMVVIIWSVAPCVASTKAGYRILGGMFFILGCFQLLTLLILSSNVCKNGCILKSGGVVSILAFLCWWLTAAICFMTPDASINSNDNNQTTAAATATEMPCTQVQVATETTTQRVEEDGTTVVEKIVTNPADGTTTCTTTIIPPAAAVPVADSNFYEPRK